MKRRAPRSARPLLDPLESRTLLSASFSALNHPHLLSDGAAPTATSVANPLDAPGLLATVAGVDFAYAAHATVLWDDGRLVTASLFADGPNRYALSANGAPASPGAHGLFITFWQTTKTGQILNRISTGNYAFVDEHTDNGVSFSGLARQTFSGKIGTLGHIPIDDAADGQQTPVTVPTQYPDGPAPEGYTTTFNVSIYWGDGSATSHGTLHKNNDGSWDIYGSHTYSAAGNYKILFLLQATANYPPGTVVPSILAASTLSVSTAHILATTHAADHPFYAFAGESATATLGRVGLSFQPADIDNSSNLAAGVLHYLPPNQTIGKVITVTIDWGDHTSSAAALSVNASGGFDVTGTHTYAKAGGYQISVRAFWTANYSPDDPNTPIIIAQPALYHGETAFTQQAWVGPAPN
jgi:hypothetical protein